MIVPGCECGSVVHEGPHEIALACEPEFSAFVSQLLSEAEDHLPAVLDPEQVPEVHP